MNPSPPITPQDLKALERAIMLLGVLGKGDSLTKPRMRELVELIGRAPHGAQQAQAWKTFLKQWRIELTS